MNWYNSSKVAKAVNIEFSPEFRNRLDAILHFNPIDHISAKNIIKKELYELSATMKKDHNLVISFDNKLVSYLLNKGFDPIMGARPLERAMN